MHQKLKTFMILWMGAFGLAIFSAHAQEDQIAIFDNQTNDFLLPSYFDTPPQTPPPTPAPPSKPQEVPSDVDILNEIFGDQAVSSTALPSSQPEKRITTQVFYPTPRAVQRTDQQPLLTPLPPLPVLPEQDVLPPTRIQRYSPYATRLLAKESGKSKANVILPKDIRLQFLPNITQLTEAAVKWITAYALHVQKDPRLVLSIRVSSRNWPVQQARLSLIMQIVTEKGLPLRQLQVFQSDRDPDTLIIGSETNPNQTQVITPEETKRIIKEQKTLSW